MIRRLAPTGLRSRLLLTVFLAASVALAAMTVGFNVLLKQRLDSTATSLVVERANARAATLTTSGGHLRAPETLDDRALDVAVWVFEGSQEIEATVAPEALHRAARKLVGGPARVVDIGDTNGTRLASRPVLVGGRRRGTVVAGLSLSPYERTERTAVYTSIGFAVAVLLVVLGAAAWSLRSTLRPIANMTAAAAAWSEHNLDQRFHLGEPYDELTRLARTLDNLLERIGASRRHERRFSAEVSHEIRTPLAKIAVEVEYALERDREPASYRASLTEIGRHREQLTQTIETLLAIARREADGAPGTGDASAATRRAIAGSSPGGDGADVNLRAPNTPVRVGVDEALLERILAPLLENARRHARTEIDVQVTRRDDCVTIDIHDDGPGVKNDERQRIFEPGVRGQSERASATGAGLGLSLARRLARVAGGDVFATPTEQGGHFTVRIPPA